ncbi:MAG: nitroreductase [Firmicutes bacterium]|nr:nitroreductase [Bacillota bacterium]
MDFLEIINKRYSVRKFASKPVEEEKLQSILEVGRQAPTAKNNQPQRLLVVREKEGLEKVNKAARLYNAPLAIIACADNRQSWKRPFDGMDSKAIDASIVTTYMMLEATRQGLGSVWICWFDPEVLRKEFALPGYIEPINILALGYPAEDCQPAPLHFERKPLTETVAYEKHNW